MRTILILVLVLLPRLGAAQGWAKVPASIFLVGVASDDVTTATGQRLGYRETGLVWESVAAAHPTVLVPAMIAGDVAQWLILRRIARRHKVLATLGFVGIGLARGYTGAQNAHLFLTSPPVLGPRYVLTAFPDCSCPRIDP